MEKELTILHIEANKQECKNIQKYVDKTENARLVGTTNNIDKAIDLVKKYLPDAVIMELELYNGGGSGISFLVALNKLNISKLPYILVTTNNVSQITHKHARQCGADFIMVKSQSDYSAGAAVDFLMSMKKLIQQRIRWSVFAPAVPIPNKKPSKPLNESLLNIVITELNSLGMSPHLSGKMYIAEAILLQIENPTTLVIHEVAKAHGSTYKNVERVIRHAIAHTWETVGPKTLNKYYTAPITPPKVKPTNMEFICYFAEKIRLSMYP